MVQQRKIFITILMSIICCCWIYTMLPYNPFQLGSKSIKSVRQPKSHEKQNLWMDDSTSSRQRRSSSAFVVRVKRQAEKGTEKISLPAVEITKSSQQIQISPHFGYFYGAPESINSYQSLQPFALSNPIQQAQSPESNSPGTFTSFIPAFLPFHQQPIIRSSTGFNNEPAHLACFPFLENTQHTDSKSTGSFHCEYVSIPLTFRLPEIPGIPDFNRATAERGKNNEEQRSDESAVHNPYENVFKEYLRECPVHHYSCNDGSKCIPKMNWCDNNIDCADASDERKCSCRDRIDRQRICDNYPDCPHGEDELGCFGCPRDSFSCNDSDDTLYKRGGCISQKERCDGSVQCSNGRDEEHCSILTSTHKAGSQMFHASYNMGFLQRNINGTWYPVCGHAHSWASDACEASLNSEGDEPELEMTSTPNHQEIGPFLTLARSNIKLIPECLDQIAYVRCPKHNPDKSPIVGATLSSDSSSLDALLGIVGGHDSAPGSWPFIVAINKNGNFHCGGALLNEWWILSAAHCFTKAENHYYEIEMGMLRRLSYSSTQQRRRLDGVIIHPHFNAITLHNDIALGLLNEPVYFNDWTRPVRLPKSDVGYFGLRMEPKPGTYCIAVGWGTLSEGGPDPDHLREVEIPVIYCRHIQDINTAEICAGFKQGGRDACQGDSGGPLMCRVNNIDSHWYIGGIVSHGIGCGRRNEPGAYTKVSHFVDWINTNINGRRMPVALTRTRSACPGFICGRPHDKCISIKKRCDGFVNCLEADDEANCPTVNGIKGLLSELFEIRKFDNEKKW